MAFQRLKNNTFYILAFVGIVANLAFFVLPRERYNYIVVHHTASADSNISGLRRAHQKRGWFEIAYHLVLANGRSSLPRGHLYATWRYRLGLWSVATRSRRHNVRGLHLCAVGNFESSPPTGELRRSLGHAVAALQKRYGIDDSRVLLHRDCSPTLCPGRHINRDRLLQWKQAAIADPPPAAEQQLAVLGRGFLPGWVVWTAWWIFNGVGILVLRRLWASGQRATEEKGESVFWRTGLTLIPESDSFSVVGESES